MEATEYKWRVRILPDENYEHDCDHDSEEDTAACERLVRTYGAWGFVTERLVLASVPCPTCHHTKPEQWEHADSCWGFVEQARGMPYMLSVAVGSIPAGETYAVVEDGVVVDIRSKEGEQR